MGEKINDLGILVIRRRKEFWISSQFFSHHHQVKKRFPRPFITTTRSCCAHNPRQKNTSESIHSFPLFQLLVRFPSIPSFPNFSSFQKREIPNLQVLFVLVTGWFSTSLATTNEGFVWVRICRNRHTKLRKQRNLFLRTTTAAATRKDGDFFLVDFRVRQWRPRIGRLMKIQTHRRK